MHRISRSDLFHTIYTIIACSRLKRRTGGRQIYASLETQEGQSAVTELICNAIDNDSKMVIATEMVGDFHKHHGKWGVDEPVPAMVPEAPAFGRITTSLPRTKHPYRCVVELGPDCY